MDFPSIENLSQIAIEITKIINTLVNSKIHGLSFLPSKICHKLQLKLLIHVCYLFERERKKRQGFNFIYIYIITRTVKGLELK